MSSPPDDMVAKTLDFLNDQEVASSMAVAKPWRDASDHYDWKSAWKAYLTAHLPVVGLSFEIGAVGEDDAAATWRRACGEHRALLASLQIGPVLEMSWTAC